jgi:hypothetical protein
MSEAAILIHPRRRITRAAPQTFIEDNEVAILKAVVKIKEAPSDVWLVKLSVLNKAIFG